MAETLVLKGTLRGHSGMVTAIATPLDYSDVIVSSSHNKSILVWHITKDSPIATAGEPGASAYGVPHRRLTGHSHFIEDMVLSSDGQFTLFDSWDGELRLWDLAPVPPPAASSATPRMSSPSRSPSTTIAPPVPLSALLSEFAIIGSPGSPHRQPPRLCRHRNPYSPPSVLP